MESKSNLDSDNFSVDKYVKSIIKDHSLSKLLDQENELKREIKLLDNDMQSLVYENYNKFINATDIVQNLKCNFSTIEEMIKKVSVKMDCVISSHTTLLEDMKPNKEKILQYSEISLELKKMQFLFDLPAHLKSLIQSQKYSHVMNEYLNANKLLVKHANLGTFQEILLESKSIIRNMYNELILKLTNEDNHLGSPIEFYETFDILKMICNNNILPEDGIASQYLTQLSIKYIEIFEKRCLSHIETLKPRSYEANETKDYMKFADEICETFLKNFGSYLIFYKILFGTPHNDQQAYLDESFNDTSFVRCEKVSRSILALFIESVINPFYIIQLDHIDHINKENIKLKDFPDIESLANKTTKTYEPVYAKSLDKIFRKLRNIALTLSGSSTIDNIDNSYFNNVEKVAPIKHAGSKVAENNQHAFDFVDELFLRDSIKPIIKNRIKAFALLSCTNFDKLVTDAKLKLSKLDNSSIASPSSNLNSSSYSNTNFTIEDGYLLEMCKNFIASFMDNLKNIMKKLTCYTNQDDISFVQETNFNETFLKNNVFGDFLFPFLQHLLRTLQNIADSASLTSSHKLQNQPTLSVNQTALIILFFSRVSFDFYQSAYDELISFAHETFRSIPRPTSLNFSPSGHYAKTTIGKNTKDAEEEGNVIKKVVVDKAQFYVCAQSVLLTSGYVKLRGFAVSRLIDQSSANRDWLNSTEPRTVRAAIRRVREEMEHIDMEVGQLYPANEELHMTGGRQSNSSGHNTTTSSRQSKNFGALYHPGRGHNKNSTKSFNAIGAMSMARTSIGGPSYSLGGKFNSTSSNTFNRSSLLHSHISKIFSEKIVIYETVELNKISILTGIVKICLKSFLESIRLKTLNTYGFQQIQVDVHYLQLYLWRFVSNEKVLQSLLDEILSSAATRSLNPVLMEQSVVDIICEK